MEGLCLCAAEALFGSKFWADFLPQAFAAIVGSGVGALLGAQFAFRLERRKAKVDRENASAAAAKDLAQRQAAAGNLALHTLARMCNDMVTYRGQFLVPAQMSVASWFWLLPSDVSPESLYRFDAPSLAFLLQSSKPELLFKLTLAEDSYRGLLNTIQRRSDFHQKNLIPVLDRLSARGVNAGALSATQLRAEVDLSTYNHLSNYTADIEGLLNRTMELAEAASGELQEFLRAALPGQTIIGFKIDASMASKGSPFMRNRAASFDAAQ